MHDTTTGRKPHAETQRREGFSEVCDSDTPLNTPIAHGLSLFFAPLHLRVSFCPKALPLPRALSSIATACLVVAACGILGCGAKGPKLAPVTGKVTFQGKPVESGMVRFSNPQAGIDIMALLQPGGTYSVRMAKGDGLPEGSYSVAVLPPRIVAPVGTMKMPPVPPRPDIPPKYREPATSGLTLTVKPEANTLDINMQPGK
jgi:hypothetical protein